MKHTETKSQLVSTVVAVTCDVCRKRYDDTIELQEFHHLSKTGGYGSVFGDGIHIQCDICQHCVQRLLGEFMTVQPLEDSESENVRLGHGLESENGRSAAYADVVEMMDGNEAAAIEWLNTPLEILGNKTPEEYGQEFGFEAIRHLVGRIEHGVFS